jgi:tripartite-type tricarboxylate transporter receptor subunit TctC
MTTRSILARCLIPLVLSIALPAAASAQGDAGEFFRGKTMSVVIPIGPGGAYDAYGRLVARHLGKQLPGNPQIVARNMPGAGGVIASNHLFNVAPQDGTTLAIVTSSFANEQLLGNAQIKYDARGFGVLGRLLDTTSVLFFWHASPIKTLEDLFNKPSTIALSSVNEVPAVRLRAMNRLLGSKIKIITGYPSARDYVLAVERGETDGGTSTYVGLSQMFAPYLREKKLNVLVQFGRGRDAAMPDIPSVSELTTDPEAKGILNFLVSNDEIGRTLITTPGVPKARLEVLQSAFMKMTADPDFQAEAERLNLPLSVKSGEDMRKVIAEVFELSPDALEKIRELSKP